MRSIPRWAGAAGYVAGMLAIACGGSSSTGGPLDGGPDGAAATGGGGGGSAGSDSGGSGGVGATGGASGSPPVVDKLDLLFMIDNSLSMADKQEVLVATIPGLVRRFDPALDIHVGVVTSSLGSHGGNVCPVEGNRTNDDRGRLLGAMRAGLPQDGNGFLSWTPGSDIVTFVSRVQEHVRAAGESGCGFEASLEAWFRFLVDPEPPSSVSNQGGTTVAVRAPCGEPGSDDVVCAQRAEFLRPDSAVAIVMISDENDCSIRDSDVGWYVSDVGMPLAGASPACDTNPNDACCHSCAMTPPDGCPPVPSCPSTLDLNTTDRINLRCWDQKRRFGIDFLYPTARYVNALKRSALCLDRDDLDPDLCAGGRVVQNPLLASRHPGLVFLLGIVGVPWQDLATDATLEASGSLEYLSADELRQKGRWSWITGDSTSPPADPLMRESPSPRTGAHPLLAALAPASADSPARANPANGHEWRPDDNPNFALNNGDLQFACIFPLSPSKQCATSTGGCDCKGAGQAGYTQNNPLCQSPDGSYGTEQHFAKGYPGLRHLAVLRDLGSNAVAASICPKVSEVSSPDHGYNPAFAALARQMAPVLFSTN
jgi:hypothetical protein